MIRNSETSYDYLLKNNRLLFSRTIYCFWNLIIPTQGIEMQICSQTGCQDSQKTGTSLSSHIQVPPPRFTYFMYSGLVLKLCLLRSQKVIGKYSQAVVNWCKESKFIFPQFFVVIGMVDLKQIRNQNENFE